MRWSGVECLLTNHICSNKHLTLNRKFFGVDTFSFYLNNDSCSATVHFDTDSDSDGAPELDEDYLGDPQDIQPSAQAASKMSQATNDEVRASTWFTTSRS